MALLGARVLGNRQAYKGFGLPTGILGRIGGLLMARGNATTEQHMVDLAGPGEGDIVLMLGPGPGVGLEAAAGRADSVIGVEPSQVMVDACRRRFPSLVRDGRVQLIQATAEHTSLQDSSVDVAIAVNNVQIWPDQEAGLREVHRVLRPGGRLLLSVHATFVALPELAGSVANAGFTEISTWTWDPPGRGGSTAAQLSATRPHR